jgi:hypothetical protein
MIVLASRRLIEKRKGRSSVEARVATNRSTIPAIPTLGGVAYFWADGGQLQPNNFH